MDERATTDERTAIVMIDTNLLRRWHTNLLRRWHGSLGRRGRGDAYHTGLAGEEGLTYHTGLAAEEGLSLIEVLASALMVGFIAIATFNGFNAANRATADERFHNQAALLAAQSQELLRSDSAKTLDRLEESSSHIYKQTIGGETFTITQGDRWISDNNQNASCSATGEEHSSQAGNYLQIHTMVTWPQQEAAGEHALEQYSIITPPDGSGLEVDVLNGRTPKQPVSGVTVVAGEGASASTATTGEAGCVIFGGIPAIRVNVEAFKLGDVTETGAIKKIYPEVLVAPNVTTHVPVTLNQGAAITAEFTHAGKVVTGDTFVAFNSKLEPSPHFEVGSTQFAAFGKEGEYQALPGTGGVESYKATASTPISSTYYPTGDLFPYEARWSVYVGDCPENNPHEVDPSEFTEASVPGVSLEPGQNATVQVPTSEVTLNAYKGTKSVPVGAETVLRPVKIADEACKSSKTPDNASSFSTAHTQSTTATGHLEAPYQPFGKVVGGTQPFKLCLWNKEAQKTYTTTYANETVAGPTLELYLGEPEGKYLESHGHTVEVKKGQASNTC